MDVTITNGHGHGSTETSTRGRDLVKTVRSLDQTGPGNDGEHIERTWTLLTSVSSSHFYAAEETVLRWLLKSMKTNNDAADTLRRFPLTWRILGCTFQRIPLFSLAKSLADRKFMAILQQTLKSISKPVTPKDAVPATLSKKRKRTLEVTFDLEALKTRDGCISTGDAVLGALRILLARVDGAAHTSQNERMGAEHIKGLFSQPASDVVTYLAPILSLCEYSATSDLSCAETQENWIHTLSAIWNLRLHGQTDSLEVALYLSRSAFGLLGKLTGLAIDVDITLEGRVKSSWIQQLESFMHRNLFLPAKSAFLNRTDLEAPIRAVDASRPIASVSRPVFFHLASTTPRILSGPSASTSEEDWAKATFKLARDGLHDLTQQKKSTTLKIMLGEAIANRSHIDLEDLRALCKEHALGSDSTDWQALSLVAQCDPDVFLLTDDGALLLNTVADRLLQPQSSLGGEEDLGAVRTFFDCIIGGYEKARDLSSFLRKWFEQLIKCDASLLSDATNRPAWFSSAVHRNPRLTTAIENSLTPKQLLSVLQWVEEQGSALPAATLVFLDTIAAALKSDDFVDAVQLRLFDLMQDAWLSDTLPSDLIALRWPIIASTVSWVSNEEASKVRSKVQSELKKILAKGKLENPDTFEAFRAATQLWLSAFPDGQDVAELAAALGSFADRLAKQLRKLKPGSLETPWDPYAVQLSTPKTRPITSSVTITSYVDFALGEASRFLPLVSGKADTLPEFLQHIIAFSDDKEAAPKESEQLSSALSAVLSNENVFHETKLTAGIIDHVIEALASGSKSSPWEDASTRAALKALINTPSELLSRPQRESIMETLMLQRRKMKSKTEKVSASTWNLVLGLMVKVMQRSTFYEGMSFSDLTALATSASPAIADMDPMTALGTSRLICELSTLTIRQINDHYEEWGAKYFRKAGRHLDKNEEESSDDILKLAVLKALVKVLSGSGNFEGDDASLDLSDVRGRLATIVQSILDAYAREWRSSNDRAAINKLLLAIDAAEGLPSDALEGLKIDIKALEEASADAVSLGYLRGWHLRTFLIGNFAPQLAQPRPTDFRLLFQSDDASEGTGSVPDVVSASSSRETTNACVDAIVRRMGRSEKLQYLQSLLEELDGEQAVDGQLLAIHQVIVRLTDEQGSSEKTTSFDLATAHSKLTARLARTTSARAFCRTADVVRLLLDQRGTWMTQWNIETTLGAVSVVASGKGGVGVSSSPRVYEALCSVVSVVIRRHRLRLEDHYHMLLSTLEALLRALVHDASRGAAAATLGSRHATLYGRLVTLVTEPSVASVSRGQHVGALDSATDAAKKTAGRHVYLVLMQYVKLQLEVDVPHGVREALEPGMHSIFDVTPSEVRKILNDAMDASGRAILRDMFKRYTQFGKWSGV
ncbi:hypothetical protein VD0002_g5480 [Verticillium dahliae]|uniref:Nucleolar 27S pre-rRNA processing Urb2/Npa2 C-terminal domain-containing protein n=1 Tax=Verticillium dahliae TaxID=27337 RepID=A0AA44WQ57_VERDA|nr:hypothetical protein BJF96_g1599 [Verticillium dahliae]PNH50808.1 hypothetical protein VD0003_g6394 [Verticillium dahliae]PNH62644.1 hypothetical protein VD0002_g5480 [Verticillium dahliae]